MKTKTDDVTVPRDLLLQVIGMTKCETEWLEDHPRKGLRTSRHKPDCRPCALHDLAKPS